jgi:protein subunit release factor B
MPVTRQKLEELEARMDALGIRDSDLIEKFILGSGPGGQKVNKTASTVYLKHLPSGLEVKCGRERSQEINRFLARRELCDLFEKKMSGTPTPKEKKNQKIQKQKKRRERRQKNKLDQISNE